MYAEKNIKH